MWLFFGIAAVISALLNVWFALRNKEAAWFRFTSLSLTALTLCAMYSLEANWVITKDWSALEDTMPTISKALWVLTIASILINSVSLFKKKQR